MANVNNNMLSEAASNNIVAENTQNLHNLLLNILTKANKEVDRQKCSEDKLQALQSISELWNIFQMSLKNPNESSHKEMLQVKYENAIAQSEAFGWCDGSESEVLRVYMSIYAD